MQSACTEAMLLIKSDILRHIGKMKIEMADAPSEEDTAEEMV